MKKIGISAMNKKSQYKMARGADWGFLITGTASHNGGEVISAES